MRKIRYDYYNVLSASCHQFGAIVRPSFNKTDVGVQMPMIFSYDCVFGVVRYMSETGILLQRPPLINCKRLRSQMPVIGKSRFYSTRLKGPK